ncbi:MAG: thiamine-phosphate kinase [Deltaproteobacteria bacterium]|nr:thiamine-phosphate kinase [Deltaproteobacteria bacterium]
MSERSGEHARIARLLDRLHSVPGRLRVANGDDAAVFAPSSEPLVATVDVSVEGVHFRRSFASLDVLGRRAAMGAASDLAAMGARPTGLLIALVLPSATSDAELEALMAGIDQAAIELDAVVAGGNLSAGDQLSITTTALGHLPGEALTRAGARPGDGIFVTAPPGHAALGLESLLRDATPPGIEPYREAWLAPIAAIDAGLALAGRAHACIDVSDGLVQDLGHVCRASECGATLELPADEDFERVAASLGVEGSRLRFAGGESYGLLFAAPDACGVDAVRVGTIEAEPGIRWRDGDAVRELDASLGFDHFTEGTSDG